MRKKAAPPLWETLTPILVLLPLLFFNIWIFGDNALSGYNQFALLFAAAISAVLGLRRGIKWAFIEGRIVKTIAAVVPAILILLLIGSLAGTWMLSGIIPTFIHYGIVFIHPSVFLPACCLSCALISMATGSSWTTVATIGVALMGIGQAMGYSQGMVAGAIISGAYFGDKMSPLSETTNMAAAVAGVPLFAHIRYMTITTVPAMALSLLAFSFLGLLQSGNDATVGLGELQASISNQFNISLWLLLIPLMVILLIMRKVSPIPALFTGTLLGMAGAYIFQPQLLQLLAHSSDVSQWNIVFTSVVSEQVLTPDGSSGSDLLRSGGMAGMLNTVWLIICAMSFGGVLEATGVLIALAELMLRGVKTAGGAVGRTIATCTIFNITASDQYLSIVVPGRMFKPGFDSLKLAPSNLSRSLEDGGTVTSVLVPWNTCGATQSAVLGVATLTYLPWCFFNLLCPIFSILVAYTNFRISKTTS
jgi:NhaC family Na+:H+ antiporter